MVAGRDIRHRLQCALAVLAEKVIAPDTVLVLRRARDQVEYTGCTVLAEQRALRTAQHFHALVVAVEHRQEIRATVEHAVDDGADRGLETGIGRQRAKAADRSEEHTSELQSLMRISYAVFCLKKKK